MQGTRTGQRGAVASAVVHCSCIACVTEVCNASAVQPRGGSSQHHAPAWPSPAAQLNPNSPALARGHP